MIIMSQNHQRILDEVSKLVDKAPKLFKALGNDSWN